MPCFYSTLTRDGLQTFQEADGNMAESCSFTSSLCLEEENSDMAKVEIDEVLRFCHRQSLQVVNSSFSCLP